MSWIEKSYTKDSDSNYWFYYSDSKSFMISLDPRESLELRYYINLSKDNKISFKTLDKAKQYIEDIVIEIDNHKKLNKEYLVNEPVKFTFELSEHNLLKNLSDVLSTISNFSIGKNSIHCTSVANNSKFIVSANITGSLEEIIFWFKKYISSDFDFSFKLNNGKVYKV